MNQPSQYTRWAEQYLRALADHQANPEAYILLPPKRRRTPGIAETKEKGSQPTHLLFGTAILREEVLEELNLLQQLDQALRDLQSYSSPAAISALENEELISLAT